MIELDPRVSPYPANTSGDVVSSRSQLDRITGLGVTLRVCLASLALAGPASAQEFMGSETMHKLDAINTTRVVDCGPYTPISELPVLKRGDKGSCVLELQRKLLDRGWANNPDGIFGRTTEGLVKGMQIEGNKKPDGIVGRQTWQLARRRPAPHRIPNLCRDPNRDVFCVDKGQLRIRVFKHGKYTKSAEVRLGDFRGPSYRTQEGIFSVQRKERMSWSNPYQVWLKNAVYFNGGQAIHYSEDFAKNGYNGASHGCVNLRNYRFSTYVFNIATKGIDQVIVY